MAEPTDNTKRGILLINLGSPDSTEVKDVARYLNEFLLDGRVIDYPWIFRKILVSGLIVPKRAPESAHAYQSIWTKDGSPLVSITRQLQQALQQIVAEPIEIAMRYGNPSPKTALDKLYKNHPDLEEVVAVPLYPHYAMSSYETAMEHVRLAHQDNKYPFKLRFVKAFYDHPAYIEALSESMAPFVEQDFDQILFSYHGIPGRHVRKSDVTQQHCFKMADCCNVSSMAHKTCYRHQVFTTTKLVTEKLQIPKDKYAISFQSRLGKGWLEPFTDIRLAELPKEGVKKLIIASPAFVSDCLETLEELEMRGREIFLNAGGESYTMIPCMNVRPKWVSALKEIIQ
jgi:ferrochelatase